MNYNTATSTAYFYDEEQVEIGKMKLRAEQVKADAEFTLWKYLIEVGVLEEEEECVEDLFERLNKELGIEEFDKKKPNSTIGSNVSGKSTASNTPKLSKVSIMKPKIPTKVDDKEPLDLYDILFTRDLQKKTKTWQDGLLKYHAKLKLAEFYDAAGVLMMKKVMEEVKEGGVVEGAGIAIEICALRGGGEANQDEKENEPSDAPIPQNHPTTFEKHSNTSEKQSIIAQNQSIIAYNILYTTDKHKKAKKWLDGRLDYDPSTRLAKFIDEENGKCFYKKVMREGEVEMGAELQTGMYIVQIDHLIEDGAVEKCVQPQAKKVKSFVANDSVPLEGRSNEQLLSLLKSKMNK